MASASGSSSTRFAGDGTVIEAACSHDNLLKEEAVKARAQAAIQAAERAPDDPAVQQEEQRSTQSRTSSRSAKPLATAMARAARPCASAPANRRPCATPQAWTGVRGISSQRKAIVEPVFSSVRCQQGLNRFRRRRLQAVKREFALHVLAYSRRPAGGVVGLLGCHFAPSGPSHTRISRTRTPTQRLSAPILSTPDFQSLTPPKRFCDSLGGWGLSGIWSVRHSNSMPRSLAMSMFTIVLVCDPAIHFHFRTYSRGCNDRPALRGSRVCRAI